MKRKELYNALENVLGVYFVNSSGLAMPELLNRAATQIFYMCGDDGKLGQNSYIIRLAMHDLKQIGFIQYED